MKKISFSPIEYPVPDFVEGFVPVKKVLPEWYKKMPLYIGEHQQRGLSENNLPAVNKTAKGCAPLFDALTTGYVYQLACDVQLKKTDDGISFQWRVNEQVVTTHDKIQHPTLPSPQEGKLDSVFKWSNPFNIKTPKGYSTIFTHPFNRWDLPFRSLTGIVDTDSYPQAVQFPFQVIDFEGPFIIIPKGTPLVQVIPFKRDSWKLERFPFDEYLSKKASYQFLSKIVKSYKNQWWVKKSYN